MRRLWAFATVAACLSCGSALKDQRTDAGLYGAQLLACIEFSDTREESRECRSRVMVLYGRALPGDAGARVDGGKP